MPRPRQPAKQYPRMARVNELVLECLADEVERLSDPRLGFVTLTGVEVSTDLRFADVYFSVVGPGADPDQTAAGLRSATPHLRSVLGRQVRMKYLPDLRFHLDPSVEQGERIERIIRELHATGERVDNEDPTTEGT
jgi:ribosome-binding factor A